MKKLAGLAAALIGLTASTAHADGGYPWRGHLAPFTFLFGNEALLNFEWVTGRED